MAFIVTDPALLKAIEKAEESLELLDAEGRLLGRFQVNNSNEMPEWMQKLPVSTPEELEAARNDPTLRNAREVAAEIKARVEAKLWPTK